MGIKRDEVKGWHGCLNEVKQQHTNIYDGKTAGVRVYAKKMLNQKRLVY